MEMSRHSVDPLIEEFASGAWTPSSAEASLFYADRAPARKHTRFRRLLSWFTGDRQSEPGKPADH
jgi:hypothetical protein